MRLKALWWWVGGAVVVLATGGVWYTLENRQARLNWLARAEQNGDAGMALALLGNLVHDYPDDPVLADHWSAELARVAENARRAAATQAQLDQQSAALDELRGRMTVAERGQRTLQRKADALQQTTDSVVQSTETLQQKADSLQQNTDSLQVKTEALRQNTDALGQKTDALRQTTDLLGEKTDTLQAKTDSVGSNLQTFQTQFGTFSSTVEENVGQAAKTPPPDRDYLFLLFKEKPSEARASFDEIAAQVNQAALAAGDGRWPAVKTISYQILKSQPANAKAAALWLYGAVRDAPETSESLPRLQPVAELLLRDAPTNFFALYATAALYQRTGNWSAAEERFRKCVEADPSSKPARAGLSDVLTHLDRVDEARPIAQTLWTEGPKDDDTGLLVWQTLAARPENERRAFLTEWRAASETSNLPDLYEGDLDAAAGDWNAAAAAYSASWTKKPAKPALEKLAGARVAGAQYMQAATSYRTLLKMTNPSLTAGRAEFSRVGERLVTAETKGESWGDAVEDGTAVLKVVPELTAVRSLVGKAYLKLGDAVKAGAVLEAGMTGTDQLVLADDLFEAYWRQKKYAAIRDRVDAMGSLTMDDARRAALQQWKQKAVTARSAS